MPRRSVPEEVLDAAREHSRVAHQHTLQPEEVGRPTARGSVVTVTWDEDESLGPRFLCRRCQPGLGRYVVAVERPRPTVHMRGLIRRHFEEEHGEAISVDELAFEGQVGPAPRAVFLPMLVHLGAGIVCRECPEGMNRLYLTPPPHGDARRIQYLLRTRADLRQQTMRYSTQEQAEYVEAFDRGELQLEDRLAGRRALRRATSRERRLSPLEKALGDLLRARAPDGSGGTAVIDGLHARSLESPTSLPLELATVLPGFAELVGVLEEDQLARAVAQALGYPPGHLPTTNKSQLWRIWTSIAASRPPPSSRRSASRGGDDPTA